MKLRTKPLDLSVKTLRSAIRKEDLSRTKLLLKTNSNLNKKVGCTANTILHTIAARKGKKMLEVSRLVLEAGADITIMDKNGNTALDIAIKKYNKPMISLLLPYYADINQELFEKTMINLNGMQTSSSLFFKPNKFNPAIPAEKVEIEIDPSFVDGIKKINFGS